MEPNEKEPLSNWAQALMAPFSPGQIGKLHRMPRWLSDKARNKEITSTECKECGQFHPDHPAVVHLDYVGHATVTRRLLEVDPEWNWEPLGWDDNGAPTFVMVGDQRIGLWIKLTVKGVTRLGFGSVPPGTIDAEKQLIGDALRNAAMRFGVALSLWEKTREEEDVPPAATVESKPNGTKSKAFKCVNCHESHPGSTYTAKKDTIKFGIKAGDTVYKCNGCGQWVPAKVAGPDGEADDEQLPVGFTPGGGK